MKKIGMTKIVALTHISLASFLWDIGKQCKPRTDAAIRGVWSGSSLFAYRRFYQNLDKNEKSTQQPLKQKQTGPIDKCRQVHLA